MADKEIHLSGQTIGESGADELHLASSVPRIYMATFTEDNTTLMPVEIFHFLIAGEADDV